MMGHQEVSVIHLCSLVYQIILKYSLESEFFLWIFKLFHKCKFGEARYKEKIDSNNLLQ